MREIKPRASCGPLVQGCHMSVNSNREVSGRVFPAGRCPRNGRARSSGQKFLTASIELTLPRNRAVRPVFSRRSWEGPLAGAGLRRQPRPRGSGARGQFSMDDSFVGPANDLVPGRGGGRGSGLGPTRNMVGRNAEQCELCEGFLTNCHWNGARLRRRAADASDALGPATSSRRRCCVYPRRSISVIGSQPQGL